MEGCVGCDGTPDIQREPYSLLGCKIWVPAVFPQTRRKKAAIEIVRLPASRRLRCLLVGLLRNVEICELLDSLVIVAQFSDLTPLLLV